MGNVFLPFPIKIQCHRVIGSNGYIGGYSGKGGIKKKIELLKLEKAL
jgi:methylated-DNA-[protein]-cysteine S-methyltransferase